MVMLMKTWYMLLYEILTAIFRGRPPPQPQPQSVACMQSMVEDTLDLHGVYVQPLGIGTKTRRQQSSGDTRQIRAACES